MLTNTTTDARGPLPSVASARCFDPLLFSQQPSSSVQAVDPGRSYIFLAGRRHAHQQDGAAEDDALLPAHRQPPHGQQRWRRAHDGDGGAHRFCGAHGRLRCASECAGVPRRLAGCRRLGLLDISWSFSWLSSTFDLHLVRAHVTSVLLPATSLRELR